MRSGLARSTSPSWRLVPSRSARWRATSGESRKVVASARLRPSPEASRRSPSSPRSGSGDADSQSRRSGRSCCIIRDERVRPRVSSATAWRVRSTSAKPKAASRSAVAASPERAGAGERLEQRPEPHPLVGAAHAQPVARRAPGRRPRWARPPACPGSRAPAPRRRRSVAVGRHRVDLALVLELHDVLDAAQEPVGVVEARGVVGVDVAAAAAGRRARRACRGARSSASTRPCTSWRSCTANSMSRMPPGPCFTSRSPSPRADLLLGADLEGADVAEVVGAEGLAPQDARRRCCSHAAPSSASPATGTRLEERLSLPRLRPPLPVGLVGREGADERAVAALGPEVEVDPEGAAGALEHVPGRRARAARCRPSPTSSEVDVAGVVELGAAELPHADDRQPIVRAEDVVGACRRRRRRTSAARSASAAVVTSRSSTPVRSRAAMRSSSRRFQATRSPSPVGGSVRGASGRSIASASASVGEHAGQAAARREHRDQRLGHRLEVARRVRQAVERRPRPAPGSADRSASSSITAGAAPAAPSWASHRVAVASSPRHRADAPISTASTRHHSRERVAVHPHHLGDDVAAARRAWRPGSAVVQRIGLGHEARAVVGGVADHRLRVDGQPRLALGRQDVGGVEVAVQQDRVTRRRAAASRIVSRARGTRPGRRPAAARAAPRSRRPTAPSTSSRRGQPVGRRRPRAGARRWPPRRATASSGAARRRRGRGPAGSARSGAPQPVAGRGRTGGRRRRPPTPAARPPRAPTRGAGAGP